MLGTADCRSTSSRLSVERRQEDHVFPFPQAAEELRAQLSTAGFPMLYYCSQGEGSRASTKRPHPWDLCQGPPGWRDTADWRARATSSTWPGGSTQPSHTRQLLARRQFWKGQKLCSCALLVLPSCTMGLWTLCMFPLC